LIPRVRLPAAFLALSLLGLALSPGLAQSPPPAGTRVLVSFDQPGTVSVRMDLDLSGFLPAATNYQSLAGAGPDFQRDLLSGLLPDVFHDLQLQAGAGPIPLVLEGFTLGAPAKIQRPEAAGLPPATLRLLGVLPETGAPLSLVVPPGARLRFPVVLTVEIPSVHRSVTSLILAGGASSAPFAWADSAPSAGPSRAPAAAAAPPARPVFDVDTMPWYRQLPMYLSLGFHHIVPEGTDHILFVLGLFFLGITWRKLLFQTTTFTVAHATTLFLSTYGIFSLPSKYVEPAIALSIAFIALENVFNPRLGPGRLAVVFCFGLIHGLGFASSLSEVPFPKHQFVVALLGFNFGVDFGQLFIIALAFVAVGWWRNRAWFRGRVAIPCSIAIAAVGVFWAVQRVIFYRHLYFN
jgi:hypothetical protein